MQFQDTTQAVGSTLAGRTDVVYADSPILGYAARQNTRIEVTGENDVAPVAVGMPKDDGTLPAVAAAVAPTSSPPPSTAPSWTTTAWARWPSPTPGSMPPSSPASPNTRPRPAFPSPEGNHPMSAPSPAAPPLLDTPTDIRHALTSLTVRPRRHLGTIIGGAVLAVLAVMFLIDVATNPAFGWSTVADYLFNPQILAGAWLTIVLTVISMTAGIALGTVLAIMRLSANPIVSTISRGLHLVLPRHPAAGAIDLLVQHRGPLSGIALSVCPSAAPPGASVRPTSLITPLGRGAAGSVPERGRLHGRDHPRRHRIGGQGSVRGRPGAGHDAAN